MGRKAKPHFKQQDQWYWATVHGKKVRLCPGPESSANEKLAQKVFESLLSTPPTIPQQDTRTVGEVLDKFLIFSKRHREGSTYEKHRQHIRWFLETVGREKQVSSLIAHDLSQHLDEKPWNLTTRSIAISVLKAAFSWVDREGLISFNPFSKVKTGGSEVREYLFSPEEVDRILEVATPPTFRDFLLALRGTGMRPGELRVVTRNHLDIVGRKILFSKHKTSKKTRKDRVIWVTPEVWELLERKVKENPTGPVFRTKYGNPFIPTVLQRSFRRIRGKLGLSKDAVLYSFRHYYITEALSNGVPIEQVATLVGHTSLNMIARIYAKLNQKDDLMHEAAKKARSHK